MRIAYVCADPGIPVFGRKGASVHVQEVIRALQRLGAKVELFATRIGGEIPAGLEGLRLHKLPPVRKGETADRERRALAANEDLQIALKQAGPFDLVYERYALWSFAGMVYANATNTPGLIEVNAPLIEEQAEHRGLVNRVGAEHVARQTFAAATSLLAVSEGVADYLTDFPVAEHRIQVIPNGVDPRRFPPNLTPAQLNTPGEFTIGFVGTLKPWHGLETLIQAFSVVYRHNSGIRLLIVGDGPQRDALQADLARHGLADAVHFTGAVAPTDVPAWLAAMDAAVAPYPNLPKFYFSPLKVYEYMAAGLSVVASRIGQIGAVIENGVTGLLCPPGNAEALTAALSHLSTEPDLRRRLGQAARMKVLQYHTWEAVARRILTAANLEPEHQPGVLEGS